MANANEPRQRTCEALIDANAAAKIIGVSPRHVRTMAEAGQVPGMRVGKYWKFRASLLDEWIRKGFGAQ